MAQAMGGQPAEFETVATDEDDTAVILYTSGTTGQPKGAELRHRNMRDNALSGEALFGADADNPDTYLCVLPLFHSFGQTVIQNGAFAYGGTVVMLPRFEAQPALALMAEGEGHLLRRRTHDVLGPARRPRRARSTFDVAGSPTTCGSRPPAARRSRSRCTRTSRRSSASPSSRATGCPRRRRSRRSRSTASRCGSARSALPIPGVEMKLLDPADELGRPCPRAPDEIGEIAIKGHNIMKGYYNRPEATAEVIHDGWFRSGDLGRRDEDGWYYIVDRSKDMIIRGGFNVYPREVEEVLMTHPAVSLAAVIGVPHESHGEEIKAVLILNDGAEVTEDEIVAWGKEQMAGYKYPRIVEFVDALPMTSTGKILKRELS